MAHSSQKLEGVAPYDPKVADRVAMIVLRDIHAAEVATRERAESLSRSGTGMQEYVDAVRSPR